MCAEAQRKLHKIQAPGSLDEVPAYVEKTTPIVDDELKKLKALERPADHGAVDAYLHSVEETLASANSVSDRRLSTLPFVASRTSS